MTAVVEAHQPEGVGERKLALPHLRRGAERASEQEHGSLMGTGDVVVKGHRGSRWSTTASPCPTPMQIAATPYPPPRRRSS